MIRIKFMKWDEEQERNIMLQQINKRASAVTASAAELFKDYVKNSYLVGYHFEHPETDRTGELKKSVRARTYRVRVGPDLYAYRLQASVGHGIPYARVFELGIPEYIKVQNAPYMMFKTKDGTWHKKTEVKTREGSGAFQSVINEAWDEVTYMVESHIEEYKKFAGY